MYPKIKKPTAITATSHLYAPAGHSSLTSALVLALLMMIAIMLIMVGATLRTYQLQQKAAEKHLLSQVQLLQHLPKHKINEINSLKAILKQTDTIAFVPQTPLPTGLNQWLETPKLLPQSRLYELGWQSQGFKNAILAMKLPKQNHILIAISVPKRQLAKTFIYAGIYLSIVALLIMLIYSLMLQVRTLRRLRYISDTANEIVEGNTDKRIPINPKVSDEYSRLSQTLNTMLDKNAQLMQELRQVNNNIAHDLKSPLNRIRSRLEVSLLSSHSEADYQQALARSIEDIDHLLKTFQALLLMGNLDSKARNYQLKKISLSQLLDNLAELYEAVSEEKSQTFTATIAPNINAFANANLLAQAVSNVLDNAIKYTPTGGDIGFSLQQQATATALITITDNGMGIPADKRQSIFERFTRLDAARQLPGTGLGMSLVRSILHIHHATIQLHDNQPGLRVEIRLRCSQ